MAEQPPSAPPTAKHPSARAPRRYKTPPANSPHSQPPSLTPNKPFSTQQTLEILEALLILEHGVIKLKKVLDFLAPLTPAKLDHVLQSLNERYEKANLLTRIAKLDDTLELRIKPSFTHPLITTYLKKKRKLSPPLTETLAIIAYNQPVTKNDIDYIRASNSTSPLKTLIEAKLIEICGHKDAPGRPALYRTTRNFLDFFAIKTLRDLPPLAELKTHSFLK